MQFWWKEIVLLAVLYFLFGRAALLLAIPPGYAMAIYPGAGLALGAVLIGGYRLTLGVMLGSLCVNLWIGHQSLGTVSQVAVGIASGIAVGAGLQAAFGAWLIRRFIGYPAKIDSNLSILGFMLLAGPIASLISASTGIGTLYGFSALNRDQSLENWMTWWVGDALGGLIITPICLILFGQPAKLWRSRRLNVLLPLLITWALMTGAFLYVRQWEQKQYALEFRAAAQRVSNDLQTRLDYHVEVHRNVVNLFLSSENVSRRQFLSFVAQPLSANAAVQAIEWAPRVLDARRAAYEQQMRDEGFLQFAIGELHGGQVTSAVRRDEYFPVSYVAPLRGNEAVLGLDLAADLSRRQTIADARDGGMPIASEALKLVRPKTGEKVSCLLVSALYDKTRPAITKEQRRGATNGLVASVVQVGDVLNNLLSDEDKRQIVFRLKDGNAAADALAYVDTLRGNTSAPLFQSTLSFGGRELVFAAHPLAAYYVAHKSWAAWGTMVGGMMFTCLVGMYLLLVSGKSYDVEALVVERTKELHDSEQRLHTILDNAAEGILTFDANGVVLLDNHAARQLLAYGDGGLLGFAFGALFQDQQDQQDRQDQKKALELQDIAPSENGGRLFREMLGLRRDGSVFDVGLSLATLWRGQQILYIVIIHDVTEKKRVERLKSEFVSSVSHELRTPLTSIRGALGLVAGGALGSIPAPAQKLIQLANDNAERLSILVNDLLDFERMEYGGMLFKMEPHKLFDLVLKVIEANQGYAKKFSIQLVLQNARDEGWRVRVDANRFNQVMSNLISNGIKFSLPQGRVEIRIDAAADEVSVWVTDHGIGIAESFQKRIFDKFSQADGSVTRKYAGTGLGLSLAKSMIEKMGGRIGFDSVEGEGARFYVALPLLPSSDS